MDESRERFDEGSAMVLRGAADRLHRGRRQALPAARIEIRPRPERSFDGRIYAVASSDDSIEAAARLKARMTMFADRPWPPRLPGIERYRALYRELQRRRGAAAGDRRSVHLRRHVGRGRTTLAARYMASYVDSNLEHYELMGTHFATAKGYDAYAKKSEMARSGWARRVGEGLLHVAVRGHARADAARVRGSAGS